MVSNPTPKTVRLYRPHGPDRVAVLSAQPSATQLDAFLIRLARGAGSGPLTKGTVYGPYPETELDARFAEILAHLHSEGFRATGLADLLQKLESKEPAKRASAAIALGWRKAAEAVEPILTGLPNAVDEVCSYLDALGRIGDPRAIPVLREQAVRKLLSRRRSAVEALRNLGDTDGLAAAQAHALDRLPDAVRQALSDNLPASEIAPHVLASPQFGLTLDTLYEIATPHAIEAVRDILRTLSFAQPNVWRYVKSIHKRAMLRRDYQTFALIAHAIESQARSTPGVLATVKSGYDGVQRPVRIFARKTQVYMKRLAWRYLRQIATYRPEEYPSAAAEALLPYTAEDSTTPQGLYGRFASCYLLHRILWGGSARFRLSDRTLRFRFQTSHDVDPPPQAREEAYPHLWDANPGAYLRILAGARLAEVHAFAVKAVQTRHSELMRQATPDDLLDILASEYEPTVALGLKELERRFDPNVPDWPLLDRLLRDERPIARNLGEQWLRLTAPVWTSNADRIALWLALPHPATRGLVAEFAVAALREQPELRRLLAAHLWRLIQEEKFPVDAADGFVRVARETLLDDLDGLVTLDHLAWWITRGPAPTLGLPAELLARRPDAVAFLGLERLATLAQHDLAAVRAAAHQLIQSASAAFRSDPSLLLVLVESSWSDARKLGVGLLRALLQPESLSLEELTGLLDSNQVEVQNLGQELVRANARSLPLAELVQRLVQHPHPNMHRFAQELAVEHLPAGPDPFRRLTQFFRTVLLELNPDRRLKERVLVFLIERGMQDDEQAAVASSILSDVVRVQGRAEFERALEGLVRLKLAYPDLACPVVLDMEGVA